MRPVNVPADRTTWIRTREGVRDGVGKRVARIRLTMDGLVHGRVVGRPGVE